MSKRIGPPSVMRLAIVALATTLPPLQSLSVAASERPVNYRGQQLMPIPKGVALSWEVDCFWGEPISYGGKSFREMGYANGQMINFMDIEASYWPARFKLAPGEKLVLNGVWRRRADILACRCRYRTGCRLCEPVPTGRAARHAEQQAQVHDQRRQRTGARGQGETRAQHALCKAGGGALRRCRTEISHIPG